MTIMPHAIRIDEGVQVLRDGCSLSDPVLRVFRTAVDAVLVMTAAADATRDGIPIIGGVAIVPWGAAALVRVGGRKVEILFRACGERRRARAGERCRLCFGVFGEEEVTACACVVPFHASCDAVRIDCPSCGTPREEIPA